MIKRTMAGVLVFMSALCIVASGVFAQADGDKGEGKTIFSYKKELNMTDQQEKDLRATLDGFQKYFDAKKDDLSKVEKDIQELIVSKGDLKVIKSKVDDLAKLKAEVTYKDIETSRTVESILKPEQIEQWKKIQNDMIETMRKQMMEQQAMQAKPAAPEVAAPAKK